MLRYLYANFVDSSCNFGNRIIEYATRNVIEGVLPPPSAEFDSFKDQPPRGDYDFLLVPGCTMITVGQNPGLNDLKSLEYPAYCLSGSVWASLPHSGWLVRNRVFSPKRRAAVDLRIAEQLAAPIGTRDRFTHTALTDAGLRSSYVGCPTLFLPTTDIGDDGYVLMALGRAHVRAQLRAAERISRHHHVVGICHEERDYARFRAAGWRMPLVTFQGDIELYLSYFKRATTVLSGRLHGALPAIAYGKRVFYYGTRDTRTTLLDDLGVSIHSYADLDQAVERASHGANRSVIQLFRDRWNVLLSDIVADVAQRQRTKAKFGNVPSGWRNSTP